MDSFLEYFNFAKEINLMLKFSTIRCTNLIKLLEKIPLQRAK